LSGLTEAFLLIYKNSPGRDGQPLMVDDVEQAKTNSFRILHDRIFIAQEIKDADLMAKWVKVIDSCNLLTRQPLKPPEYFSLLNTALVTMALEDPYSFGWFRRLQKLADDNGQA
jgi:hypothetical protein